MGREAGREVRGRERRGAYYDNAHASLTQLAKNEVGVGIQQENQFTHNSSGTLVHTVTSTLCASVLAQNKIQTHER